MKYSFKFLFFFGALFLVSCGSYKFDSDCIDYVTTKNTQDMPLSTGHKNSLTNLSDFTFFAMTPTPYDSVKEQLQKYTTVNKVRIFEETKSGVLFNEVSLDPVITFEIKEIYSVDGKDLLVTRASLSVASHVIVEKTKEQCDSYIWTKNCFMPGDAYGKNGQELITKSLDFLMELFIKDYSAVNSTKPIFNLVDPDAKTG